MKVKLSDISNDASIQCRASINIEVLNSYAERMTSGDVFPDVELFSDGASYWIADGWHRVMAAKQIGAVDIEADVKQGSRFDALKAALKANSVHGLRRSNEDKRRCVEIASREFGNMSSRAIADMCGVSVQFVCNIRPPDVSTVDTSPITRTDTLGRQQPAHKPLRPASNPAFNPFVDQPTSNAPGSVPEPKNQTSVVSGPKWTPTPICQPVARPSWLPPDDDDAPVTTRSLQTPQQREESSYLAPARTDEPSVPNNVPRETDSVTLFQLKRYWGLADRNERNAFVVWVKANKDG